MPADMLHFHEWAEEHGLKTTDPGVWNKYEVYVGAWGIPVEPEPTPPPAPPKVTVVNRLQAVKIAGLRPAPAYSRVISMVAIAKFEGNPAFAISEAIGNAFTVLDVWTRVYYSLVEETPELYFRLTTGVGVQVDQAIVHDWEPVIPLVWEGHQQSWIADQKLFDFHWSLDKRMREKGRRLGLWTNLNKGGVGIATVFASFRIAEG